MYVYYLPKNTRLDRNAATVVATFIQVAIQLLSWGLSGIGHPKYSCLMFHYNIYFFITIITYLVEEEPGRLYLPHAVQNFQLVSVMRLLYGTQICARPMWGSPAIFRAQFIFFTFAFWGSILFRKGQRGSIRCLPEAQHHWDSEVPAIRWKGNFFHRNNKGQLFLYIIPHYFVRV